MKVFPIHTTLAFLVLACSCQEKKDDRQSEVAAAEAVTNEPQKKPEPVKATRQSEVAATEAVTNEPQKEPEPVKAATFYKMEDYYAKVREKYIALAEAKNEDEFLAAWEVVLNIHAKRDIPNFKLSCPYFYQRGKLETGMASGFDETNEQWVIAMGQDLHKILTNMLQLAPGETVDLALRVFATRLQGRTHEEFISAEQAREFLSEFNDKLAKSLESSK